MQLPATVQFDTKQPSTDRWWGLYFWVEVTILLRCLWGHAAWENFKYVV